MADSFAFQMDFVTSYCVRFTKGLSSIHLSWSYTFNILWLVSVQTKRPQFDGIAISHSPPRHLFLSEGIVVLIRCTSICYNALLSFKYSVAHDSSNYRSAHRTEYHSWFSFCMCLCVYAISNITTNIRHGPYDQW